MQYDNSSNTIKDQMNKNVMTGAGNPLLANLKAKRDTDHKLGFTSNAPRFNEKKVDEADAFIGPGYYD